MVYFKVTHFDKKKPNYLFVRIVKREGTMAREGRSILGTVWKNFVNSLKPRQFKGDLMGTDNLGNDYYEIPRSGSGRRPSRWFTPKGGDESKFDDPLPAEWESWLRHRRKYPPSQSEIQENLAIMKMKQDNARDIEKRFSQDVKETPGKFISFPKRPDYEQYPGKKPDRDNSSN